MFYMYLLMDFAEMVRLGYGPELLSTCWKRAASDPGILEVGEAALLHLNTLIRESRTCSRARSPVTLSLSHLIVKTWAVEAIHAVATTVAGRTTRTTTRIGITVEAGTIPVVIATTAAAAAALE